MLQDLAAQFVEEVPIAVVDDLEERSYATQL
jgi:hypothetical protein